MLAIVPLTGYFNPLPRKEGDSYCNANQKRLANFNPLPRKEGDQIRNVYSNRNEKFQSTPS